MAEDIQVPASRRWSAMAGGTPSERLGETGVDGIGMVSVHGEDERCHKAAEMRTSQLEPVSAVMAMR